MNASESDAVMAAWPLGGSSAPISDIRWRRVFPGHARELSAVRRWLSSLLPDGAERGDVLCVATELCGNAIQHTASGLAGGCFAVEITVHEFVVQVAVADGGGPAEPRVIEDLDGEHGRGLLLVHGLSARTGVSGDQRGRLVWAQVARAEPHPRVPALPPEPVQAAARDGQAALAQRSAGVPGSFEPSSLAWRMAARPQGRVPAVRELAGLLRRHWAQSRATARAAGPLTARVP
jgi:serine/threonine-protein kinase RsbW